MQKRRIVVTGIGAVTPLAGNFTDTWEKVIESKSGIRKITEFDISDLNVGIAGFVPIGKESWQHNPKDYFSAKELRRMDHFSVYAVAAAEEALKDSGYVAKTEEEKERTAVIIGSGIGGINTMGQGGILVDAKAQPRKLSPFFITQSLINLSAGHVSIRTGFKGPNHSAVTACATGTHAISDASRLILNNEADRALAGATESAICRLGISGFAQMKALSTQNDEPTKASRPWDKKRDGFVMGEGGAILMLEEYEAAKKRGANIYAEVVGWGLSGDAYHITAPHEDGEGGYRAMKSAVKMADIDPKQIDYINAHGTSTPLGDMLEIKAIRKLMNNDMTNCSISSTKSSTGHLLGGAGALEASFLAKTVKTDIIPPTLNLDNPEDGLEDIDLVPHKSKNKKVNYALSNSFGFGGTNASVLFKKI